MKLAVGATLQNGKYAVTNILGQSDLSLTLKATQAFLNQTVVLKTVKPNAQIPVDFAQLKQRFGEDARRFARCQHPGLVRLLDFFEEGGLPFAVMDFVGGQSLADRVRDYGPLPEAQALQYIRQVGSALSVVHKHGLVHKSVNPSNLVRPAGTEFVVLVDYGILDWTVLDRSDDSIQQINDPYRAIEYYQPFASLIPATDIYALAATLYFLLTGHPPIPATRQEQSPLPAPRKLRPDISAAVEAAILNGMAAKPQARPQTIAAWFAQLPGAELLPPVQLSKGTVLPDIQPALGVTNGKPQTATTNGKTQVVAPPAAGNSSTVAAKHPVTVAPLPSRKSRLPKVLVGTATIAVLAGLGLGLVLRLGALTGIGPKIFHTQQTFPPLPDWDGAAEPVAAPAVDTPRINPSRPLRAEQPVPAKPKPTPTPSSTPIAQPSPEPTIEALPNPTSTQTVPPASPAPLPPQQINPPSQPETELPPPSASGTPSTKSDEPPTKSVEEKEASGQK